MIYIDFNERNCESLALLNVGEVTVFAGGGSPGGVESGYIDGTGWAAMFYNPRGIVVDSSNTIYVAERNNLIRRISSIGRVHLVALSVIV